MKLKWFLTIGQFVVLFACAKYKVDFGGGFFDGS
jgi:hypothetical protein